MIRVAAAILASFLLLPFAGASAGNAPASANERLELARDLTAAIED